MRFTRCLFILFFFGLAAAGCARQPAPTLALSGSSRVVPAAPAPAAVAAPTLDSLTYGAVGPPVRPVADRTEPAGRGLLATPIVAAGPSLAPGSPAIPVAPVAYARA